jgi:hypothetical protein
VNGWMDWSKTWFKRLLSTVQKGFDWWTLPDKVLFTFLLNLYNCIVLVVAIVIGFYLIFETLQLTNISIFFVSLEVQNFEKKAWCKIANLFFNLFVFLYFGHADQTKSIKYVSFGHQNDVFYG